MSEHVTAVTEADFAAEVLAGPLPVVVDFWATWCGPCRQMEPALEQVAADLAGQVKVVKVDVDNAQGLAGVYGIRSVPTVIIFKNGQPVRQFVGAKPAQVIAGEIAMVL